MKRKRKGDRNQKPAPPRRSVGVEFPQDLFAGVEAIAAMEGWSMSRTVVEIVRSVLAPAKRGRR